MEATSPKYRIIAIFEYGFGWGIGVALVPLINELTHNYQWFLAVLLLLQLLMLPWLHLGIFESIRWLLSEGHVNRAQIELGRACRINRVQTNPRLAQKIAEVQVQQVRRASRIIDAEQAPEHLARALESEVGKTTHELDLLSAAIKRSFGLVDCEDATGDSSRRPSSLGGRRVSTLRNRQDSTVSTSSKTPPPSLLNNIEAALSPTLARKSFSVEITPTLPPAALTSAARAEEVAAAAAREQRQQQRDPPARRSSSIVGTNTTFANLIVPNTNPAPNELTLEALSDQTTNLTQQDLIQLAMKYSKTVEQQEEGGDKCFLLRMLNRRLWRETLILTLASIMLETAYYGMIQANKFVGNSVNLNYLIGATGEWASAIVSTLMMVVLSRRLALVVPVLVASSCCYGMALSYHLLSVSAGGSATGTNNHEDNSNIVGVAPVAGPSIGSLGAANGTANYSSHANGTLDDWQQPNHALRDQVNFYIMNLGKFAVTIAIQVTATIQIEAYPSNLRQTGPGAIIFIGRCGSILAPFLFNDASPDKWILQVTLVVVATIGLLVSIFAPFTLRDFKNKELCDHMSEI